MRYFRFLSPAGKQSTVNDLPPTFLKHFMAEHTHQSLEHPTNLLEHGLQLIDEVVYKLFKNDYEKIPAQRRFAVNEHMANLVQHQIQMMSLLSRTSRSYAVGLKNADVELLWTTEYGARFEKEVEQNCRDLRNGKYTVELRF